MKTVYKDTLEKFERHVSEKKLFSEGDRALCALSGGADSVALLVFLKKISDKFGITVYAAHLNHCIRGEEADRDERFCASLCDSLEIPFISEKIDVPSIASKRKNGLEEAAREVRYDFLNRIAKATNCNKICTAHHADDNIETVLLHLIRGCGLEGLKGIAAVRGNIVRPLLVFRKRELVDAITEMGYSFVHDSTNDDTYNSRNYIRSNILPHIYKLNESADKAFYRMCASLQADSEYIDGQASAIPENTKREKLAEYDDAVLARYIRLLYKKRTGKTSLDNGSVLLIIRAVKCGDTVKYDVTGDTTAFVNYGGVDFLKRCEGCDTEWKQSLEWGENFISPIGYKILITKNKNVAQSFTNIYKTATMTKVNSDKIIDKGQPAIIARGVKSGDEYIFGKMKRSVRRQLIAFKIPRQKRERLPVLCTDGEIFFVCGLRLADGYAPTCEENTVYVACAEIDLK